MDIVLFQRDNWLYFLGSEAVVSERLLSHRGIESCLAGPVLRRGSCAGILMAREWPAGSV